MKIYVIRHGHTELNKKGIINSPLEELTEEGIDQAKIAISLLPKTIKHIYCSSLIRTKQTAEILNKALNVPITFHEELREVDFGVLTGTPFLEEYNAKHKALNYDWRPSGECMQDVKIRVLKILKEIKKENGDGEVLIITHGGIVRLLYFLESGKILDKLENPSFLHSFDLNKILK